MKKFFISILIIIQLAVIGLLVYFNLPFFNIMLGQINIIASAIILPYSIITLALGILTSLLFLVFSFRTENTALKVIETIIFILFIALAILLFLQLQLKIF